MIEVAGVQLSETEIPVTTSGAGAWQLLSALAEDGAGHVTLGGVVSLTVNVVVHVAELPAASVAVTVIVCGPSPTFVPAVGLWVTVIEPDGVQLSVAVVPATTSGIAAWQLAPAEPVVGAGHVTCGGVVSFTVNVVVHVAVLPAASVAVIVIVCGPSPTFVPAVGLWAIVIEPDAVQLSVAETPPRTFGTAAWQLPFAEALPPEAGQ